MQHRQGAADSTPIKSSKQQLASCPTIEAPLSCTSAASNSTRTLGPNLSSPFVLPPPPHWKPRLLSPNLFPLNARFLLSPHSHCLRAPHPPVMLGIASTSSCLLCVCLSCSRYKRRAVFAAYLDTRDCLPHISALPIRSIHLQFSNFAPGAVITGNGCFIKSILVAT